MRALGKFICRTFYICAALCLLCACNFQYDDTGSLSQDDFKPSTTVETTSMEETTFIEETNSIEETCSIVETESRMIRLGFAGDMNLDESWATTQYLTKKENGIYDCINPELIEELTKLDVFMVNNEFTYSDRGTPTTNKLYTFRANKDRVDVLEQLGTDIVLLANNHVFDYGEDAFWDTLQVLNDAKISYVGAGKNLEEACQPCYFDFDGFRIAYVAATKAEKYKLTPQAGVNSPGVLRCYDPELYLQVIEEASNHADYVIASVHFGTEYECMADDSQRDLAYEMIDAGADAVIGSHAHVLQGMEFYQDKPIVYNLGNFWFNDKDLYSCVVELELQLDISEEEKEVSLKAVQFLPCTQYECYTDWIQQGEKRDEILSYVESISFGVTIDEQGIVRRIKE
ncbi:MAG TPA: CapA family protein [Lachnospiraceae bacterium]|nr:CapA family protein [Lachnospiraceae bacterium]